jgi:hypothetical protein
MLILFRQTCFKPYPLVSTDININKFQSLPVTYIFQSTTSTFVLEKSNVIYMALKIMPTHKTEHSFATQNAVKKKTALLVTT